MTAGPPGRSDRKIPLLTEGDCWQKVPGGRQAAGTAGWADAVGTRGLDRLSASFPLRDVTHQRDAWDSWGDLHPGTEGEVHRRGVSIVLGHGAPRVEHSRACERRGHVDVQTILPTAVERAGHRWQTQRRRLPAAGCKCEAVRKPVTAYIGAQYMKATNQWWGKIECNPARIADPDGRGLLRPDALPDVVALLATAVGTRCEADGAPESWRTKRADVAVDFDGLSSIPMYLLGLAPLARPYATRKGLWTDASSNNAQTLHVGNGAGMMRAYDQHEAYADRAPPGSLRVEVEARDDWLGRIAGIERLEDAMLIPQKWERLLDERWRWGRMDTEVISVDDAAERVCSREDLSNTVKTGLLGRLMMLRMGVVLPGGSHHTASKYDKLLREMAITVAPDAPRAVSSIAGRRLDLETQTEVLRAA